MAVVVDAQEAAIREPLHGAGLPGQPGGADGAESGAILGEGELVGQVPAGAVVVSPGDGKQGPVRHQVNGVWDRTWFHGARGPEYERVGSDVRPWYVYDGLGSVVGLAGT